MYYMFIFCTADHVHVCSLVKTKYIAWFSSLRSRRYHAQMVSLMSSSISHISMEEFWTFSLRALTYFLLKIGVLTRSTLYPGLVCLLYCVYYFNSVTQRVSLSRQWWWHRTSSQLDKGVPSFSLMFLLAPETGLPQLKMPIRKVSTYQNNQRRATGRFKKKC